MKTPWHIWVVGVASLFWNAMGGVDYTMTHLHNTAWLAQLTPEQIAYINSFPAWATACWAFGVWGAVVGSVLLLLRSRWAVAAFAASLLGLIGSHIFQFGSKGPDGWNTMSDTIFASILAIVAIALLWYARVMRRHGVLR
ncbi:MAG: hypothetical protein ABL918_05185 [Chakrabartia sp.]